MREAIESASENHGRAISEQNNWIDAKLERYHATLIQEITAGIQQIGTSTQLMVSQKSLRSTSGANCVFDSRRNSVPETTASAVKAAKYRAVKTITMNQFCSCVTKRKRYNRVHWGNLSIVTETSSSDHHTFNCPLSRRPLATSQTMRLSFSVPIVQRIWNSAAKISLSLTTGTGGFNFGQRLTWVTTVDSYSSPAFRIVEVAGQAIYWLQHDDMHELLGSCFRRLIWCYATRQSSVTDVDERGNSMLERAAWEFYVSQYAGRD